MDLPTALALGSSVAAVAVTIGGLIAYRDLSDKRASAFEEITRQQHADLAERVDEVVKVATEVRTALVGISGTNGLVSRVGEISRRQDDLGRRQDTIDARHQLDIEGLRATIARHP